MVLPVRMFQDGFILGKVCIADLILNHDPGKLRTGPSRTEGTPRRKQKSEEDVYNIGDDDIKEKPEETAYHLSNVTKSRLAVNPRRVFLSFPRNGVTIIGKDDL